MNAQGLARRWFEGDPVAREQVMGLLDEYWYDRPVTAEQIDREWSQAVLAENLSVCVPDSVWVEMGAGNVSAGASGFTPGLPSYP